jgi:hypothetical protein
MLVRRGSIRSLVEGSYEIGAWFHAGRDPLQADAAQAFAVKLASRGA